MVSKWWWLKRRCCVACLRTYRGLAICLTILVKDKLVGTRALELDEGKHSLVFTGFIRKVSFFIHCTTLLTKRANTASGTTMHVGCLPSF